jgi:hypothetical protein
MLTFKRAVLVDSFAELRIGLEATAVRAASNGVKFLTLGGILVLLALLAWAARGLRGQTPTSDAARGL